MLDDLTASPAPDFGALDSENQLFALDRLVASFDAWTGLVPPAPPKAPPLAVQGLLPEPPALPAPPPLDPQRCKILRNRLKLLGYLAKDNESPLWDPELAGAVENFRLQAGLEETSEVEILWDRANELVGFEPDFDLEDYYQAGQPLKALLRAVQLRLFALGFTMQPPGKADPLPQELLPALGDFLKAAQYIGFTAQLLPTSLNATVLDLLFDQDCLVNHLAKSGENFSVRVPTQEREDALALLNRFVICTAKIELWLLGYAVVPDGYKPFLAPPPGPFPPAAFPLPAALMAFWRDQGLSADNARARAMGIGGSFFSALVAMQEPPCTDQSEELNAAETRSFKMAHPQMTDRAKESDDVDTLTRIFQTKPDLFAKVWLQVKDLGASLWDGMKRLFSWFKKVIANSFEAIFENAKNLARWLAAKLRDPINFLRNGFDRLRDSLLFLFQKPLPGSDPDRVWISHQTGGDYLVFVHPEADSEQVSALLGKLKDATSAFSAVSNLLGGFLRLLRQIWSALALGVGWPKLLLSLIRGLSQLKSLLESGRQDWAAISAAPDLAH